jgi:hypothetical protein
MARRTLLTSLAALCAALIAPTAAPALIQVDRGIAGARLGNTRAEVRAALGAPSSVQRGTNEFGPFLVYRYNGPKIRVNFQGRRRVTNVSTTGLGDRTRRGVGVGSTEAAVVSRVGGVTCESTGGSRLCHTGDFLPGRRVTDFRLSNGKVESVTVALVVD